MNKTKLIELVKKQTAILRKQFDETESECSPMAKKIEDYLKNQPFGCNNKSVGELMSILLGEKIDVKSDSNSIKYTDFSMLRYTEPSKHGHNEIGDVVITFDDDCDLYHIRAEKFKGSCWNKKRMEPVEDDVIEKYITGLDEKVIEMVFRRPLKYLDMLN